MRAVRRAARYGGARWAACRAPGAGLLRLPPPWKRGLADGAAASEAEVRGDKMRALRERGAEPFAAQALWARTSTASAAQTTYAKLESGSEQGVVGGDSMVVMGRVMACRWFGKMGFVSLQDGSGRLQLLLANRSLHGAEVLEGEEAVSLPNVLCSAGMSSCSQAAAYVRTVYTRAVCGVLAVLSQCVSCSCTCVPWHVSPPLV